MVGKVSQAARGLTFKLEHLVPNAAKHLQIEGTIHLKPYMLHNVSVLLSCEFCGSAKKEQLGTTNAD